MNGISGESRLGFYGRETWWRWWNGPIKSLASNRLRNFQRQPKKGKI